MSVLPRRHLILAAGVLLGLAGGAIAVRKPSDAILLCSSLAAILGLAMAGERAFPWAIAIVAVVPWYPFVSTKAEPPIFKQKVLCAAVAAAPLVPWLWSLATGGRRTRPSRASLLMGLLFAGLAILIYASLGSISALIEVEIVGFLFGGVTFLCARRFGDGRGLLAAAFGALLVLGLLGIDAYTKAPTNRIGYFVGYPITYGALVVGLLPAAILFASQHSRLLTIGVTLGSASLLIFSESRSSWVALTVMLVVVVLVQTRAANFRALAAVATITVILTALIVGTGLHHVVEQKLSSKIETSQSVTHREFSYGYAVH